MLPVIDLQEHSPVKDINQSELLLSAAKLFLKHGVLLVKNVYDEAYIQCLHEEYNETYKKYLVNEAVRHKNMHNFHDAKGVGHNRIMIPLHLKGSFNSEKFYANEGLMPLLEFLLGKSLIINSLGSVFSLPGSPDQHIHRDMANIYLTEENTNTDDSWLQHAPPYAITVATPLIPITPLTGNTRFWPGTHLSSIRHNDSKLGEGEDFTCNTGDCILFDYRVIHAGMSNKSDQIRPLLYNVYSRDWFRDSVNYEEHPPLNITSEQLMKVPKHFRKLFSWSMKDFNKTSDDVIRVLGRNELCFCKSGLKFKYCHGKLK